MLKTSWLFIMLMMIISTMISCGNKKPFNENFINEHEDVLFFQPNGFQSESAFVDISTENVYENQNRSNIKTQCIADYLYNFAKHMISETPYEHLYTGYTLIDNTENWYLIRCLVDEFEQPNNLGISRKYEFYAAFCVTECDITPDGIIKKIKYDKNLGLLGLIYESRSLSLNGPGDELYINELKKDFGWGRVNVPTSIRVSDEVAIEGKITNGLNGFIPETPIQIFIDGKLEDVSQIHFDDYYLYPELINGEKRNKYVGKDIILVGRLSNEYAGDPDVTFYNVRLGDPSKDVPYKFDLSTIAIELEGYVEEHTERVTNTLSSTQWTIILDSPTELVDINGNKNYADIVKVWPIHAEFSGDSMYNYSGKHVRIIGALEYSLGVFSMIPLSVEIIDS